MIPILFTLLIISFIISIIIFFVRSKYLAFGLSLVSILLNVPYLFMLGDFEKIFISKYVGYFGVTVNNLNFPFIITILVVTSVTTLYSLRYMEHKFSEEKKYNWGLYYALYSLFALSMLYVVSSINLLELYIFLEISLISSFLLIALYGYGDRRRISLMYFIWTHIGTILLLASIIIIGLTTGTMDIYVSAYHFMDYSVIPYSLLVFIIAVIGMFIKGAQAGFNIWLPYAHGEAPTPISILLSPNMVGLGIFVVIIYYYLFHLMSFVAPIFIAWALITMIYGGVNALAQKDFKRFLAYSSVSQMGYMLLGASIAFISGLQSSIASLPLGILASILIYVSHGFGKALLFMSAGASITELNERNIDNLGGLYLSSPLHSTLSFIGVMNLLGLPPTIGLVSEALLIFSEGTILGKIGLAPFVLLVAFTMIAIGTSSAYAGYLFKKVYAGKKEVLSVDNVKEYSISMILVAISSIVLFFLPQLAAPSLTFLSLFTNSIILPLIVFLPLLGSLIALITPKSLNQDIRGAVVVFTIGVSTLLSIILLVNNIGEPLFGHPIYSFSYGYIQLSSNLLQSILALFVSSLSFFIALYSIGYMKEDSVLRRYWGFFGLFVSSMLSVVLANNILFFIAGWEGTSLASYGLISYWLDDNPMNVVGDFGRKIFGYEYVSKPTTSGIRALIFTRVGDVGFLAVLGYLIALSGYNFIIYPISNITITVFSSLTTLSSHSLAWILLLILFLGGLSKSAQFPFTQWLLTAMTGPTPVSALIHAATMVNLGAILTFLAYPFIQVNGNTLLFFEIMVGITLFTAIYTSVNALATNEQKVILAFSTADQISLMIFSSSLGALLSDIQLGIIIGLIQMIAHGIYKASLFMNAGSVIHFTESRYVGSRPLLYRELPSVFILQLIAALNLANLPPLIGFWAHDFIGNLTSSIPAIFYVYVILEFLGSLYILRYISRTFLWRGNSEEKSHGHLSMIMVISPAFLILASIILGGVYFYIASFFGIITYTQIDYISLVLSAIGWIIAFLVYTRTLNLNSIKSLLDFGYYGWYVNPAFDKFGYAFQGFSNTLFRSFERGAVDIGLNEKLPRSITNFGSRIYNVIEDHVLGDYILLYAWGVVVLLIIVLILFGVIG
ncbi:oxidoreductase [Sulfolobus sp. A20]|uniref:proton-conducting transporter transmembrane domain-containing protein n=1 Tax=Sulfolobaceae TaxID=118883 RepID=UPI000845F822|nr:MULTISPECIES: proton-conducting transporter membrane subunit [unclassified Sulfolobus]TRM76619.1 oxidoreductase [Sulfolobus sp. A20-N-F8]TRM83376.1 oxidoreductase [Sulfolobus sp. A20-N-F6]TRM87317.1 oxidoreductase [Sulfolobus sp. C3]TRM88694.1 oxidoreductase [Sulfolobus sp. E3]TRM93784.1 oxidoreductase [Sulfolobus sp. A20-N-G8]TRN00766.1 oxidoreductase [Sulfolobus sp. E1]TRN01814.1 oxidoreductase [Sulfolobus sp. F1]